MLIMRHYHRINGHLGKQTVLNALREKYYIIGASRSIKKILKDCIICRKLHTRPTQQLMGDLPKDRLECDIPPFTNIGIDAFGPFLVIRGRGKVREKRYGLIFSCLSSRAIHLELSLIHISEPTRLLSISYAVFCL